MISEFGKLMEKLELLQKEFPNYLFMAIDRDMKIEEFFNRK